MIRVARSRSDLSKTRRNNSGDDVMDVHFNFTVGREGTGGARLLLNQHPRRRWRRSGSALRRRRVCWRTLPRCGSRPPALHSSPSPSRCRRRRSPRSPTPFRRPTARHANRKHQFQLVAEFPERQDPATRNGNEVVRHMG